MLSRLRRGVLWVSRAKYCRGFGIQSPWAYRFVRYVVNEHYPYYAYDDLRPLFPKISRRERRLCELYLRLANYCQADEMELIGDVSAAKCAYIHAGCAKTVLRKDGMTRQEGFAMAVIAYSPTLEQDVLAMVSRAKDDSMLVVEGVHKNAAAHQSWVRILRDKRVRISFDLYYCGILFFDRKKYKQNYKINF